MQIISAIRYIYLYAEHITHVCFVSTYYGKIIWILILGPGNNKLIKMNNLLDKIMKTDNSGAMLNYKHLSRT